MANASGLIESAVCVIDYLLSSLCACSAAVAASDYDTVAKLRALHDPLPSGCWSVKEAKLM